jgi:hypothetical protein
MTTIDEKNTKADIIDASIECVEYYAEQNDRLRQQQNVLMVIVGILFIWGVM